MTRLATCSYREFKPDMGVPVRTSLGQPRWWRTPIPQSAVVSEITPRGWYFHASEDDFLAAYTAQLSRYGAEAIQARFDAIAAEFGEPLVLLCFEQLQTGAECHRTDFRLWWLGQTGQDTPELGALPPHGHHRLT
jgi:hypothetical protein